MNLHEEFKEYENLWEAVDDYDNLTDDDKKFFVRRTMKGIYDFTKAEDLLAFLTIRIEVKNRGFNYKPGEDRHQYLTAQVIKDFIYDARQTHKISISAIKLLYEVLYELIGDGRLDPGPYFS